MILCLVIYKPASSTGQHRLPRMVHGIYMILFSLVTKFRQDTDRLETTVKTRIHRTFKATGTLAVKTNLAGLVTININKTRQDFETTFAFLNILINFDQSISIAGWPCSSVSAVVSESL